MRIVFVTPYLGDVFGQERVLRDSARLLKEKGHRVFFLTNELNGPSPVCDGIRTVPELTNVHSLSSPGRVKTKHQAALQFLAQVRPDIVHFIDHVDYRLINAIAKKYSVVYAVHSVAATCPASHRLINGNQVCTEKSGWNCLKHHKQYGCLSSLRGYLRRLHAVHNYLLRREAFKRVEKVIAVSEYIKQSLIADGWPENKIKVIPNPVAIPKAVTPLAETPQNLIYCAARLTALKGINFLLLALSSLKNENWNLWVSGDGPQREELERLSETLGIRERVRFIGKTSYQETQQLMASAKFLVQPNVGPESFGLSVAEATALGVPVIAFDVPAINEIIEHNRNGLLVERANVKALSESIRSLLRDELTLKRLGSEGPKVVRAKFSPESHLEKTLRLYTELVDDELLPETPVTWRSAKP